MFNLYKNTCESSGVGASCRSSLQRKIISFGLVLTLMFSILVFNPNAGPPVSAEKPEVINTGNWDDTDENGIYKYADFSWYDDPIKEEFTLTDEYDLAGLAVLVNNPGNEVTNSNGIIATGNDFAGKEIRLELPECKDNLELGAHYWVPIGLADNGYYDEQNKGDVKATNVFKGSFNGCNYKIKNMKIGESKDNPANYKYAGLFGYVGSKDIKIKIENIAIGEGSSVYTLGNCAGGIAGYADYSTISGCGNLSEVSVTGFRSSAGGIAGHADYSTISDCSSNAGNVSSAGILGNSGGIAGHADYSTISNCINAVDVICKDDTGGGITGHAYKSTISNCINVGNVTSKDDTGGIAGFVNGEIINCSNSGGINSKNNGKAGGIFGYSNGAINISNCSNSGNVSSAGGLGDAGGIAGEAYGANIRNCNNWGEISGNRATGGISGEISGEITNCSNSGLVTCTAYAGGIAGKTCVAKISNCINMGEILATYHESYTGGIAALAAGEIINCSNWGKVSSTSYRTYMGGIAAYVFKDTTISNAYYGSRCVLKYGLNLRIGIGNKDDQTGTTALSEKQIKAAIGEDNALVKLLNKWVNENKTKYPELLYWKQNNQINNGYPYLDYS